jgi:hypothetical protein
LRLLLELLCLGFVRTGIAGFLAGCAGSRK